MLNPDIPYLIISIYDSLDYGTQLCVTEERNEKKLGCVIVVSFHSFIRSWNPCSSCRTDVVCFFERGWSWGANKETFFFLLVFELLWGFEGWRPSEHFWVGYLFWRWSRQRWLKLSRRKSLYWVNKVIKLMFRYPRSLLSNYSCIY